MFFILFVSLFGANLCFTVREKLGNKRLYLISAQLQIKVFFFFENEENHKTTKRVNER